MEGSRRDLGRWAAGGLALAAAGTAGTNSALGRAGDLASGPIAPSLLDYLTDVQTAIDELANTWHPQDPAYRADLYRQIMMNLSYAYFVYFNADAEHPDWSPLYNSVFSCQPNPDDIYLFSPVRSDLSYRVSGHRGTVQKLIFVTQKGIPGTLADFNGYTSVNSLDERDFKVDDDGEFEILFSAKKPAGYTGNWSELKPGADVIFVRYRMVNWETERDPQLSIECLDPVPLKPRLTPQQIVEKLKLMARVPGNMNHLFYKMQNDILNSAGYNVIQPVKYPGLAKQVYWPAVFQLADDEALIIESDMPEVAPYWNIQLNDPLYNAVEFVYRQSHINAWNAYFGPDKKLRAVIALTDPGVPNWLDPCGYNEGTIYGRWYDTDTQPTPVIKRVKLAELREFLPNDTPTITPEQRAEELRRRVRAAQRRRRW
jgi:hypothetical protein